MRLEEFDRLELSALEAITQALRDEDESKNQQEARRFALFCNAHFKKKTGGDFSGADFLPEVEGAAEQAMEDRMETLRATGASNIEPTGEGIE